VSSKEEASSTIPDRSQPAASAQSQHSQQQYGIAALRENTYPAITATPWVAASCGLSSKAGGSRAKEEYAHRFARGASRHQQEARIAIGLPPGVVAGILCI
jgi:hypothetical protein